MRRAIRLALVTHDAEVIRHARELNISTFETIGAAERGRWKRGRGKVFTNRFQRPKEEPIPDDLKGRIGNRIFGCDDCLDACPYNMNAVPTDEPAFQPSSTTLAPDLRQLELLTEAEFASAFRQSPIRRAKHVGFMRNVSLALAKNQTRGT